MKGYGLALNKSEELTLQINGILPKVEDDALFRAFGFWQ